MSKILDKRLGTTRLNKHAQLMKSAFLETNVLPKSMSGVIFEMNDKYRILDILEVLSRPNCKSSLVAQYFDR